MYCEHQLQAIANTATHRELARYNLHRDHAVTDHGVTDQFFRLTM